MTVIWAAVLCVSCGQVEAGARPPAEADLAASINQLGADQFDVRQAAMERLWAAGDAAIPLLQQALQDKSAEVRARSQYVLDNLQLGITYDTPRSILREVNRFRTAAADGRRLAIQQLEAAGRHRIIQNLLLTEADPRLREEWYQALERSIVRAIVDGSLGEVAETLRRSASEASWMRHLAAFAAQRGTVDEELSRLADLPAVNPTLEAQRRVYLQRAQGDLKEAARSAEQVSADFQLALLAERHAWAEAARHVQARLPADLTQADVNQLGLAAAYHQLAHDEEAADRCIRELLDRNRVMVDELQKLPADQDGQRRDWRLRHWQIAKSLLLIDRYEDALQIMKPEQLAFVFELLCDQQRYREAFALVDVPYPSGFSSEWFRQVAATANENSAAVDKEFTIALHALRHLAFLGERAKAKEFLGVLIESANHDRGTRRLRMLCDTAVKMSLSDEALGLGATIIQKEERPNVLSVLFPNRSAAQMWWEYFRDENESDEPLATLQRINKLLNGSSDQMDRDEFTELADAVADHIRRMVEGKQVEWWHELAKTAMLYKRRDLAYLYFGKASELSANDALELGDLYAEDTKWQEAAAAYRKAWEFDKEKPLPLYLHARALLRVQQSDATEQLAERALLMPLANEEMRHGLATGLKERGFRQEAQQQFELLMRTGEPSSGRLIDASKQVGNLIYNDDPLRAADSWQLMLLCCFRPNWGFVENGGYIQIPFLVHKTRAKGLLKQGDFPAAWQEIESSLAAWPGNIDLAEEVVPLLDELKRTQEAEALFSRTVTRLRELLASFPDCPTLHNNLAWLCARNDRELDEALLHAREALRLEPGKASFLDTLAEVYFRRQQFSEAVAAAEQSVKADPDNALYKQQLERFRNALPK